MRVVWADPVTGSSLIPNFGQKYLETKSYLSPDEEMIKPCPGSFSNKLKFGLMLDIWFSELNTAKRFMSPK